MKGKDRLIVALDVASMDEALSLVDELKSEVGLFKVGLELFTNCGTRLLDELKRLEAPVFFDGKFHDIPNTVSAASREIAKKGVEMFNVHAVGGGEMIRAARKAADESAAAAGVKSPILLAVTVLTSMSQEVLSEELGIKENVEAVVARYASLAKAAGANGVVASAKEVKVIREVCGQDFLIVTPGIRPSWASDDDQKRIVTPKQAVELGTDYVVVGRPITKAANRKDAAKRVAEELNV
ncbi:MAG: orotidine-5'-phosphate decarboxylase [Leptolyngbya sp.]|nr:orotidine-5'-phosphate decarboxylase [Candidatus Melainabacteria bacterium]